MECFWQHGIPSLGSGSEISLGSHKLLDVCQLKRTSSYCWSEFVFESEPQQQACQLPQMLVVSLVLFC